MIFVRFMAADFRLHEELSYSLKRKWPFLPDKMKYEMVIIKSLLVDSLV